MNVSVYKQYEKSHKLNFSFKGPSNTDIKYGILVGFRIKHNEKS